jgi:hypothetical protein
MALALIWGDWSVSRPGLFTPGGKRPRYSLDRRLGGTPEPVWTMWRKDIFWQYRDSDSDPYVVQSIASRYIDCTIPAPCAVTHSIIVSCLLTKAKIKPRCFAFCRICLSEVFEFYCLSSETFCKNTWIHECNHGAIYIFNIQWTIFNIIFVYKPDISADF